MTTTQIIEALAQSGYMIQIEFVEGDFLVNVEGPPDADFYELYSGGDLDDIFQQI